MMRVRTLYENEHARTKGDSVIELILWEDADTHLLQVQTRKRRDMISDSNGDRLMRRTHNLGQEHASAKRWLGMETKDA
jgi:hypothetical protein